MILDFLSPLLTFGAAWITAAFHTACLFIEGIVYELVSYTYELFTLMTQLNFNSIAELMGPLINRIKAVMMVLIVFKLGIALIGMLLNPDSAPKEGKQLFINLFVTAALLATHGFFFDVLNEVGMLFVGAPSGYTFPTLSYITGESITEKEGVINRFVFGSSDSFDKISDMGEYMAYQVASIFIVNLTEEDTLGNTIKSEEGNYNFLKLPNIESEVDRKVSYTPLIGVLIGGYLIYVFFNISAEVGIRMFKLLVLQMIAPLAIISIINDGFKGGFKGTMQKYVNTYMSTFTQLFIRIVCTLVVTVFIGKFVQNIGSYFGQAIELGEGTLTKGLLIALVIFSGYKFVLEAPKLIDSIFKTNLAGSKKDGGFAASVAGMLTGGVAGVVGGAAAGGGLVSRVGGAVAGGAMGLGQGFVNGTKGQSVVDAIKNTSSTTSKRSADWKSRGGFGNVTIGAGNDIIGRTKRQDNKMNIYQSQMDAVDAYEKAEKEYNDSVNKAQVDAIKGDKLTSGTRFSDGREAQDVYSSGYESIVLGESADGYAQRMMEYDKEYQAAQAALAAKKGSGASESELANAQQNVLVARDKATQRAKDYWNDKKNATVVNIDNSKVNEAKEKANKELNRDIGFGERRKTDDPINIKEAKKEIVEKQKKIQGTKGYKVTHQNKDK